MSSTRRDIGTIVSQHPTTAFVAIACLWSWTIWIPAVLLHRLAGTPFPFLAVTVGAYGPTVSALAVSAVIGGRRAVGALVNRLTAWRVAAQWYVAALVAPWAPALAATAIDLSRGRSLGLADAHRLASLPLMALAALPNGPLGEELGWRGFLLPRMASGRNIFGAALLVGFVWTFWHTPLFWAPAGTLVSGRPISVSSVATYLAVVTGLSCVIAWIWVHTRGSVFVTILAHLSINLNPFAFVFPAVARVQQQQPLWLGLASLWTFVGLVVLLDRSSWQSTRPGSI